MNCNKYGIRILKINNITDVFEYCYVNLELELERQWTIKLHGCGFRSPYLSSDVNTRL